MEDKQSEDPELANLGQPAGRHLEVQNIEDTADEEQRKEASTS